MNGGYCHQTGKACLSEATAKAILDHKVYWTEDSHPRTYYWCKYCSSFHLTSQTGKRYYRKKIRIRERIKTILVGD